MCGLFGMISKFKKTPYLASDVSTFFDMSVLTSLRGRDSSSMWGIHREHPNRDPRIWKTLGDPFYLINTKAGEQIEKFMDKEAIAMFGHGRKATSGKVTLQNAHPFRHKNLTLSHNGTIHGGLDNSTVEVEVDSHALTILAQEKGILAALSQVEGAFAVIAYDTEKRKILIARNYQRPLHYVESTDMIYIMSDKKPLEYVMERLSRHNLWIKDFVAMQLYEIDVEQPTLSTTTVIDKVVKPYVSEYVEKSHYQLPRWTQPVSEKPKQKSFDDSTWKIKRGEMVRFIVDDHIKPENSAHWKFWGQDDNGNHVIFFDKEPHHEWLDRIAQARVQGAYPDAVDDSNPELVYIVKAKDIDWLPTWDDLTEINRIRIMKDAVCHVCNQPFCDDDIPILIIEKQNPLIVSHGECDSTVRELEKAIEHASNIPV